MFLPVSPKRLGRMLWSFREAEVPVSRPKGEV